MSALQLVTTPEVSTTGSPNMSVFDRAIIVNISLNNIGNIKQLSRDEFLVKTGNDEENADRFKASKRLMVSPELKAITTTFSQIRAYVKSRALPFPMRDGMYVLPVSLLEEADAKIGAWSTEIDNLAALLADKWEEYKEESRLDLGDTYNESDYKTAAEVRREIGVHVQYIEMTAPGKMKGVRKEFLKREQEKFQSTVTNLLEDTRAILRDQMSKFVSGLVDTLTGKLDGKKKKLHDTAITKFQDFLTVFEARDLSNDTELQEIVAKAKAIISGVSPESIKAEASVMKTVNDGFTVLSKEIKNLVTDRPSRVISFEEE